MNSQSLINWACGPNFEKEMEMTSNSKLTPEQKAVRKELIALLPNGSSFSVNSKGVTVLCVPNGKTVEIATSILSDDEQKFRRKVGEYFALIRWNDGATIKLPADTVPVAYTFAEAMGGL